MKNTSKITKPIFVKIYNFGATCKLSDMYNSRSTKYHSIYDSDFFVQKTDPESIVSAGYSKLCKAIISLNLQNEITAKISLFKKELSKVELYIDSNRAWLLFNEENGIENFIQKKIAIAAEAAAYQASIRAIIELIVIDELFISEIIESKKFISTEKNKLQSKAFSELLQRNNISVETDHLFWEVFRGVKSKIKY